LTSPRLAEADPIEEDLIRAIRYALREARAMGQGEVEVRVHVRGGRIEESSFVRGAAYHPKKTPLTTQGEEA